MNDYDDSDDYSSANSFRARSNTWPLNRPDLAVPNGVCIDETLPEIELEEDDLFTTNENWSTGLVDHDIMSWDPILNAQHLQHVNTSTNNTTTNTSTNTSNTNNNQHQSHTLHHQPQQPSPSQQQHPQQTIQQQHHHQQQQPHDTLLSGTTMIVNNQQQLTTHQLPPQHHQTNNNTNCLDADDPNDYHIQQLHHLSLDNNQAPNDHQAHFISSLSSTSPLCIQGSTAQPTALGLSNDNYHLSSDHHNHHQQQQQPHHHHHHLQPLTSARYDLDQQNDLDLKAHNNNDQHHSHPLHHQHPHSLPQHQHHQQQPHHQQIHHVNSTSLDHHSANSHMLSSSLSTSGIGLSGDLEDLDYKGSIESASIIHGSQYDETLQGEIIQGESSACSSGGSGGNEGNTLSNSATSSKTKLNTPRRNAWGNMSYADLISQAINSTNDKRLTLSQIYDWMVQHVPYFKDKGDSNSSAGWKNSVRHNLSLHNRFKRLQNEGTGKSSWWTINPEAKIGKCARRRAASMEASKYEKKRGRAKKRADAIRQGLISYPSLTNSSLNGSTSTLEQQNQQLQSSSEQFGPQTLSQQQKTEGLNNTDNKHNTRQPDTGIYVPTQPEQHQPQQQQQPLQQYEQKDNNNKMQQQPPQPQQLSQSPPTTTPPLQQLPHQTQQKSQQPLSQQPPYLELMDLCCYQCSLNTI